MMINTRRIFIILLGAAMLVFLIRCSRMEPSQSLSDIQTPENAVSNAPTAASQRLYQQQLQQEKSEARISKDQ